MKERLTIALVAHDHRKKDLVDWARFNAEYLSRHHLVCTGTTGGLILEALREKGIEPNLERMQSGPMGGDAEIAAKVVRGEIDFAVFLIDDLNPQPHEADIQMLLRQCRIHNVPIACNLVSADHIISSRLWNEPEYHPKDQSYTHFDRQAVTEPAPEPAL